MDDKELLYKYAKEFREAIEKVSIDELPSDFYIRDFFKCFPRRQCGSSTIVLGQYLLDKGIKTWYICGIDDENKTHAWLSTKDPRETRDYYIIDITSDQFGIQYPKVYADGMNEFYKRYDSVKVRESWSVCDIEGTIDYKELYDIICSYLVKE